MNWWIARCAAHTGRQIRLISVVSTDLRNNASDALLYFIRASTDLVFCLIAIVWVLLTSWWLPPLRFIRSRAKLRKVFDAEMASIVNGKQDSQLTAIHLVMRERLRLWPNDPDFSRLLNEIEKRQRYLSTGGGSHDGGL